MLLLSACLPSVLSLDSCWQGFVAVVTHSALPETQWQMPCPFSNRFILPPFVVYLPKGEQALRPGLSDIQLLRYSYLLSIITQKDILFTSGSISMLYKRAFRKEKEVITFLVGVGKLSNGTVTGVARLSTLCPLRELRYCVSAALTSTRLCSDVTEPLHGE